MRSIVTVEELVIFAVFAGFIGLIAWIVRGKRPPKGLTGTANSAAVPDLSMTHAWFCGVIPIVAIVTILANLSKPLRKRASQGFAVGCLGPLLYYLILWILFTAIGDNEDLKSTFGLLGLIGFLVLPFFILHFVRGSLPPTSAIGNYEVTSGSPSDSVTEPDAQPAIPEAQDKAADSRSLTAGEPVGRTGAKARTSLIAALLLILFGGALFLGRNTAMLLAARNGSALAVMILLALGADVNARSSGSSAVSDRRSALAWAATFGHDQVVRRLLAKGADVETEPGKFHINPPSPLLCAAREGHTSTLGILLGRVGTDHGTTVTLLGLAAAGNGHADTLRLLLSKSQDPRMFADSCLWMAVSEGHSNCVRVLLDAGADPNGRAEGQQSLIAIAATAGRTEILNMLKEAGAKGLR
ncbi:MAG: ankyrin repeat domain-containing protein [Bryobacterales bacterium]|nr:ankyrin repeat domain-containing protein [Bryobacterales bacterium]